MEDRKAFVRSFYGENHPITGDYDKSLAVKCVNGTYVGKMKDGVIEFKGIPFVGVQPDGKNRYKAPIPYEADDGVYEAYFYEKSPCQSFEESEEASFYHQSEACLYLNVWKNTEDANEKKPVMMWIHGGAFEQGGTVDPLYQGYNFAKANPDVTLVTITYRVGAMGFIHLSHLPDGADYPDAQNLGLLDQQMALRWIYENIAGFGGDPENITVFGESAGGCSVTLLPLMPEAKKYVRRVIAQSGTPVFTRSTEEAIQCTNEMMEILGCKTVAELLEKPMEDLINADGAMALRVWPERDGVLIPEDEYEAYAQGAIRDVDFMQGCNKDEFGYFVRGNPETFTYYFGGRIEAKIASLPPEDAEKLRSYYDTCAELPYKRVEKVGNQLYFIAPSYRLSECQAAGGGKVWQYYFRVESCLPYVLSGHAVEVAAVLNNPEDTVITGRPFDQTFCRTMQRMWVQFAKTGDPSLTAAESPDGKDHFWPQYTSEKKEIMVFDEFDIHTSTEGEYKILDWERCYPLTKYYTF